MKLSKPFLPGSKETYNYRHETYTVINMSYYAINFLQGQHNRMAMLCGLEQLTRH